MWPEKKFFSINKIKKPTVRFHCCDNYHKCSMTANLSVWALALHHILSEVLPFNLLNSDYHKCSKNAI